MSSVILTDIIQTVLETSECSLSKYTNNMHILATGTEEQAIYSGHLWAPYSSKLLNTAPSHKKLIRSNRRQCMLEQNLYNEVQGTVRRSPRCVMRHVYGEGYKTISRVLKVSKSTVVSFIWKLKKI